MEAWKTFEEIPDYEVSNIGRVRRDGSLRAPFHNGRYMQIKIWSGNARKTFLVHRMVAACFLPNPHGLPQVNHKDGNKLNNEASNLEWCTAEQNVQHAIRTGLYVHPGSPFVLEHINALMRGVPVKSIVREIGGGANTVRALRVALGINPFSNSKRQHLDIGAIIAFQGSVRQCAREFGISKTTAHKIRNRIRGGE